jgi:hypothetical protein
MAQRYTIEEYDIEKGTVQNMCYGIRTGDIVQVNDKEFVYVQNEQGFLIPLYTHIYSSGTLPYHNALTISFSSQFHPSHWRDAIHNYGSIIWFNREVLRNLHVDVSQEYGMWMSVRFIAKDSHDRWNFMIEETTKLFDTTQQVKDHMLSGRCYFEWRSSGSSRLREYVHVTLCDEVHF